MSAPGPTFREQDNRKLLEEFVTWFAARLWSETIFVNRKPTMADVAEFLKQRRERDLPRRQ